MRSTALRTLRPPKRGAGTHTQGLDACIAKLAHVPVTRALPDLHSLLCRACDGMPSHAIAHCRHDFVTLHTCPAPASVGVLSTKLGNPSYAHHLRGNGERPAATAPSCRPAPLGAVPHSTVQYPDYLQHYSIHRSYWCKSHPFTATPPPGRLHTSRCLLTPGLCFFVRKPEPLPL